MLFHSNLRWVQCRYLFLWHYFWTGQWIHTFYTCVCMYMYLHKLINWWTVICCTVHSEFLWDWHQNTKSLCLDQDYNNRLVMEKGGWWVIFFPTDKVIESNVFENVRNLYVYPYIVACLLTYIGYKMLFFKKSFLIFTTCVHVHRFECQWIVWFAHKALGFNIFT